MMTSLKLKWMEKHKVLHCFILINLQQPTVKSPKYMFPHIHPLLINSNSSYIHTGLERVPLEQAQPREELGIQ